MTILETKIPENFDSSQERMACAPTWGYFLARKLPKNYLEGRSMARLFEPLRQRDVTFRNRIGVLPMCQYSSQESFATDWHRVHLGRRAVGGAGLVFTEAAAIAPHPPCD